MGIEVIVRSVESRQKKKKRRTPIWGLNNIGRAVHEIHCGCFLGQR